MHKEQNDAIAVESPNKPSYEHEICNTMKDEFKSVKLKIAAIHSDLNEKIEILKSTMEKEESLEQHQDKEKDKIIKEQKLAIKQLKKNLYDKNVLCIILNNAFALLNLCMALAVVAALLFLPSSQLAPIFSRQLGASCCTIYVLHQVRLSYSVTSRPTGRCCSLMLVVRALKKFSWLKSHVGAREYLKQN